MNYQSICVFVAFATVLTSCSEGTIDRQAEAQELMELSREWSTLVGSGNVEATLDFWAEDAVMLPPDLPVLYGKAAIREYVTRAEKLPGYKIILEPESAHISKSGDMAYLIERNVVEFDAENGDNIVNHGKVVTIWRKDSNGQWKNVVDMWIAAPPPSD